MKSLYNYLRAKRASTPLGALYRNRALIRQFDEDIRCGRPYSPGQSGGVIKQMAWILNLFSSRIERGCSIESLVGTLEITPERLIRQMDAVAGKAKDAVFAYRARGIDPQVEVTLKPAWEMARGCIARYKRAIAPRDPA